jgi:hypothetical protein
MTTNEALPELILHVGLRKTGSSFLQSFFALNSSPMYETSRLYYPPPIEPTKARQGVTTSGNAPSRKFRKVLRKMEPLLGHHQKILVSREQLVEDMCRSIEERASRLRLEKQIEHFQQTARLHVIVVVRDPFEWAYSKYQQAVKHDRCGELFDDWVKGDDGLYPAGLPELLGFLRSMGMSVDLINYSRSGKDFLNHFLEKLGLPIDFSWNLPPVSQVNRSFTSGELRLALLANRISDWTPEPYVADQLLRIPYPGAPATPALSATTYEHFKARAQNLVSGINSYLEPGAKLMFSSYDEKWSHALELASQDTFEIERQSVEQILKVIRDLSVAKRKWPTLPIPFSKS